MPLWAHATLSIFWHLKEKKARVRLKCFLVTQARHAWPEPERLTCLACFIMLASHCMVVSSPMALATMRLVGLAFASRSNMRGGEAASPASSPQRLCCSMCDACGREARESVLHDLQRLRWASHRESQANVSVACFKSVWIRSLASTCQAMNSLQTSAGFGYAGSWNGAALNMWPASKHAVVRTGKSNQALGLRCIAIVWAHPTAVAHQVQLVQVTHL